MAGIRTDRLPQRYGGPSLVAAASALMLLPENASRHVRLYRLAAAGMALPDHGEQSISPSALRSLLKNEELSGINIQQQEDQYSEVLVQSVTFAGGPYLVSGGSGEHSLADLESLIEASFRSDWMPAGLRTPAFQLVRGLLTVSDLVLSRAGLTRGTRPAGSPRTPIAVPGAAGLAHLETATFISHETLATHGPWLEMVVDTLALDPSQLADPCSGDYMDDRLFVTPFLRLPGGYRVVLPLDLAICIRFHLLRFVMQDGQLEEFGRQWGDAVLRRHARAVTGTPLVPIESTDIVRRYIAKVDDKRAVHVILATDPLTDWEPTVWGHYDTQPVLERIAELVDPQARKGYSDSEELVHLVVTDSPGRAAFWGLREVSGADPLVTCRSDDLEVILHSEPDGLLGLLLFAQATRNRPGSSVSLSVLDEFSSYQEYGKSFYMSDDQPPDVMFFNPGDGLQERLRFATETDRHGVILPRGRQPIVQVQRRYDLDAPEIYIALPNTDFIGCVVELDSHNVFVSLDVHDGDFFGFELELLDCVTYWIRECAVSANLRPSEDNADIVLVVNDAKSWLSMAEASPDLPIEVEEANGFFNLHFSPSFSLALQDKSNRAERGLVSLLLRVIFSVPVSELQQHLEAIAPEGPKRMLNVFDQGRHPDMLAAELPAPLTGHGQVSAQLLDNLGEWLRAPAGGGWERGVVAKEDRTKVLNSAVSHLFDELKAELSRYEETDLLNFLVLQNEALTFHARRNSTLLRSRLACFGERSSTVSELVEDRKEFSAAHRANRFLLEYLSAVPPGGSRTIGVLDYYRLLSVAREIIERATVSDFLQYGLADFEVSILESGRLGVSRDDRVTKAIDAYGNSSGMRSVKEALGDVAPGLVRSHGDSFIESSNSAMKAEFGFTLSELREVCGGLLDLSTADGVTRIARNEAVLSISRERAIAASTVSVVIAAIELTRQDSFEAIGRDARPWRFGRDRSYLRRPLVLQGQELVFGFRSVYRLGIYWSEMLLSGRLQARARTDEMKGFISKVRSEINNEFAHSVAGRLTELGMTTRVSVKKIGKRRIVDDLGQDLGDIDVLAVHPASRTIFAVEAKDFEVARTPVEMANELDKLFGGRSTKKSTTELHQRRVDWIVRHASETASSFYSGPVRDKWRVVGAIVTSEPLIAPLVSSSPFPVVAFEDLSISALTARHAPKRSRR